MWSTVRKSLSNLKCKLKFEGAAVALTHREVTADSKREVRQLLSEVKTSHRLDRLLEADDQGRCFHLISKHSSSSQWIRGGAFVSFAEYRFAIKGRLNLLPTKAVVRRAGNPNLDTTCPKCKSQLQTLGHVLNACTPNAGLMRERHNYVLKRLSKALPESAWEKFLEQKIKDSPGGLETRPCSVASRQESIDH